MPTMLFWSCSAERAEAKQLESLRSAEKRLLDFAKKYTERSPDSWELKTLDTPIPRSVVPLKSNATSTTAAGDGDSRSRFDQEGEEEDTFVMHCVHAVSASKLNSTTTTTGQSSNVTTTTTAASPLVMLHGYMNAGAYFYRNLGGLSEYFESIYAVDMLGWGLSSRPSFDDVQDSSSIRSAEDFFVESLEAWRSIVRCFICSFPCV